MWKINFNVIIHHELQIETYNEGFKRWGLSFLTHACIHKAKNAAARSAFQNELDKRTRVQSDSLTVLERQLLEEIVGLKAAASEERGRRERPVARARLPVARRESTARAAGDDPGASGRAQGEAQAARRRRRAARDASGAEEETLHRRAGAGDAGVFGAVRAGVHGLLRLHLLDADLCVGVGADHRGQAFLGGQGAAAAGKGAGDLDLQHHIMILF